LNSNEISILDEAMKILHKHIGGYVWDLVLSNKLGSVDFAPYKMLTINGKINIKLKSEDDSIKQSSDIGK
jgi:hypothetical protein